MIRRSSIISEGSPTEKLKTHIKAHKPETIIIACALGFLFITLVHYLREKPISIWYEHAAVLGDLALFCAIGIVFVMKTGASWRAPAEPRNAVHDGWRRYFLIFVMMLAVHALRILCGYALQIVETEASVKFVDSLNIWKAPDSIHYANIASHWYRGLEEDGVVWRLVFLPFYSILIKGASFITGEYFYSAVAISVLCSSAAGCVLYALARLDMDEEASLRAVKYFALLPAAFFFTTAMTESLFMLLSLLCIYGARRKKWLLSGIAGGLAAFTRSVGLLLIAPVFIEWITALIADEGKERRNDLLRGFMLLLIPLGFAAYLRINYVETGDPFTFMTYQKEHWFQEPGWFFDSVRYQLNYLVGYWKSGKDTLAMGLSIPNLLAQFSALALMTATARKQRPSYLLYFLAYFAVTMGVTWLLSAPRYLLVLFPLVLSIAELTKKRQVDTAATVICTLLGAFYFLEYYKHYGVY
ncbi:MAG: glycosyltransferase family 39 protein [Clostridia bacterium]|nr:glycosyltransferase family 39 protein [Clostridia bacterium]